MSEEQNDGTWSGLVKTIVGTVGTIVTAGGAYLGSQLFDGDSKSQPIEGTQPNISAPAPVINITTNNSQQQAASNGGTKVIERVVEKPAAEKPKKKTEKEALEEEPKW
jgi:hypothetical protein